MDGTPSYELFESTVLQTVILRLSTDFEAQLEVDPGSPARMIVTTDVLLFPKPLVFYAMLVNDTVELVGITDDDEMPDGYGS